MDTKPAEGKTIKTIVPIKGKLLAKIKSKLTNKDSLASNAEKNDLINNNNSSPIAGPAPTVNAKQQKPTKSKVIIQKIEKVQLNVSDILPATTSTVQHPEQPSSQPDTVGNEEILVVAGAAKEDEKETTSGESSAMVKLLVAKMPDNECNKEVPLKLVRTMRKPKPNIIRQRFGQVSVHKNASEIKKESVAADAKSDSIKAELPEAKIVTLSEPDEVKSNSSEKQPIESTENEIPAVVQEEAAASSPEEPPAPAEGGGGGGEEAELMDTSEAVWLNDISVMIGESRIMEIDQGLKKIPAVVTGNKIQTENVELKLIINHLLEKLKVKTVTETLEAPSKGSFNLKDSSNYDFSSDTFDSEDDFSKDSSFFNENFASKDTTVESEGSAGTSKATDLKVLLQDATTENVNDSAIEESEKREESSSSVSTRKRRASPASSLGAKANKRMKEMSSMEEESCDSDNSKLVQSKTTKKASSVASRKSLPGRRGRRPNLIKDSSRESSVEQAPNISVILANSSVTRALRSSSREKSTPVSSGREANASKDSGNKKKKVTRVQELRGGAIKSSASKRSESSSSEWETPEEVIKNPRIKMEKQTFLNFDKSPDNVPLCQSTSRIAQNSTVTPGIVETSSRIKSERKNIKGSQSKNIPNSDSECETLSTPSELKSSSSLNDFNSKFRSSIIERNDYLKKSSSVDKTKNELARHPVCVELENSLKKIKESDPLYSLPSVDMPKRHYLKTSAFKGNLNRSDDTPTLSTSTDEPSVSQENSQGGKKMKNGNIKSIMLDMIDKQKEKQLAAAAASSLLSHTSSSHRVESTRKPLSTSTPKSKPAAVKKPKIVAKKPRLKSNNNTSSSSNGEVKSIKVFEQEVLEKPIEKLVMYNDIMEAIRVSHALGAKIKKTPEDEVKRAKIRAELLKLPNFHCGSCDKLVTKHKWSQHVIEHGGIAWIDQYENPIDIENWNEAIRRLINNMRIYRLDQLTCPNCGEEKRSALGHLSHVYTCAQDAETIEKRKAQCQTCDERVMPYNMSWHRTKCKGLEVAVKEEPRQVSDADGECSRDSSVKSGGRLKREAVKRAEKKLRTIVNDMKSNQDEASDFEGSSSDASLHDEASDETEGSSGVESSDMETVDEEEEDELEGSNNLSYRKGKLPSTDTEEIKAASKLVTSYTEMFQNPKLPSKTAKWTKDFVNEHLSENILTTLAPKYKTLDTNLSSFLLDMQLNSMSMKFSTHITDDYSIDYGRALAPSKDGEWQELEVGKEFGNKQSLTLFCGGVVSALDWAQSLGRENFLAVACNSLESSQTNVSLEQTQRSCIQVYRLQSLVNEKFSTYVNEENISTLLYTFSISDGPIWSIRFHPFVTASDERIGLLAVSTANQYVYIFSLPYLRQSDGEESNRNLIISLEPSITCRLSEEFILFQDKYLLQVSTVNWYYRKGHTQFLAAGYINGYVALWTIEDETPTASILPYLIFQPHMESITSIDFKGSLGAEILMITTSMDRDMKVFAIENNQYREIVSHYGTSRITCAEWSLHWPGYLYGNDNCFVLSGLIYRQPLDFATRNNHLLQCLSSITDLNINQWMNYVAFVSDSGDVFGTNPPQLLHLYPKDKWEALSSTVLTYTDIIVLDAERGEHAIVFNDVKSKLSKRPKSFRIAPTELSQKLQINAIRFNRNEVSHRFYAIGYETGFVRIRHLKNFK